MVINMPSEIHWVIIFQNKAYLANNRSFLGTNYFFLLFDHNYLVGEILKYHWLNYIFFFCTSDFNECLEEPCHVNSTCKNMVGSFRCECNQGFIGDGINCTGKR